MRRVVFLVGGLFLLAGLGRVVAGVLETRAVTQFLHDAQNKAGESGGAVSWGNIKTLWWSWGGGVEIARVRLAVTTGEQRILYGCDDLVVTRAFPFSPMVTVLFRAPQAFAMAEGQESEATPRWALRFDTPGGTLRLPAKRPGRQGGHAVLSFPVLHLEVRATPPAGFLPAPPYELEGQAVQAVAAWDGPVPQDRASGKSVSGSSGLAFEMRTRRLSLPSSLTGRLGTLGHAVTGLYVAASVQERRSAAASSPLALFTQAETPATFVLHMAEGELGPLQVALSGRAVREGQMAGDFNVTVRGLEATATHLAEAGTLSPQTAGLVRSLEDMARRAATGDRLPVLPSDGNTGREGTEDHGHLALSLPLRLRDGRWTLGTLPLDAALAAVAAHVPAVAQESAVLPDGR